MENERLSHLLTIAGWSQKKNIFKIS